MKSNRRGILGKRKRVRLFEESRERKMGQPPGTPIHLGAARSFKPFANLFQYGIDGLEEHPAVEPERLSSLLRADRVNWLNVEGVHEVPFVQAISSVLDLHPLTQEDIVNTSQRPQFESYPGYYFFAIKMLYFSDDQHLTQEHVSLILKGNTLLSFQETPGDVFSRIRERLRAQTSKVRSRGSDYLLYMLIDSIVDGYYQVVDRLGEQIDRLEEELRCGPRDQHLARIYELRREILFLRKNIIPVRDLLNKVQVEGTVFQDNTKIFLKDLSDHITQVTEALSLSMDMSGVLIETYHSLQNQRMNAVMKTLTMISTVFLPLNFIAGVYGMNFSYMPELHWRYAYPLTLGLMVCVAVGMVLFFIRKGWLLENRARRDIWQLFDFDQNL